jgi:sporulation protein YlmC with PRC-barrel domain
MTNPTHPNGYRIGAATATTDGEAGTVGAIVVDPLTRAVTHLAVDPKHRHHRARLVPIGIATAEPDGDVRIACDRIGFEQLPELEQLEIIDAGLYGRYDLHGYDGLGLGLGTGGSQHVAVWTDQPPEGEAALRRDTAVNIGLERVGHVEGLLTGPDGRISAVLVASGHAWKRRTIAVPVDAVTAVDAGAIAIADTWDQLGRRP